MPRKAPVPHNVRRLLGGQEGPKAGKRREGLRQLGEATTSRPHGGLEETARQRRAPHHQRGGFGPSGRRKDSCHQSGRRSAELPMPPPPPESEVRLPPPWGLAGRMAFVVRLHGRSRHCDPQGTAGDTRDEDPRQAEAPTELAAGAPRPQRRRRRRYGTRTRSGTRNDGQGLGKVAARRHEPSTATPAAPAGGGQPRALGC